MSDQPAQGVSFQGQEQAGQPAPTTPEAVSALSTASPVQAQGNGTTPEYITREEALRLAKEAADEAFRKAQSLVDKGQAKVRERLDQFEAAMKGVNLPEEQKARMRQEIINAALAEPEKSGSPAPGAQPAAQPEASPGQDQPPDPVTEEAWRMMETAGVVIEDGDPEAGTLDQSSAYKFLQSIEKAIQAKQARLNVSKTPTTLGGAGGVRPSNPIESISDPAELLKLAFGSKK